MQSPDHYGDTILMDYIISHNIGFSEGNIMKYVSRWDKKDGLKDLYKARDYLNALIAFVEKKDVYTWDPDYPQTQDLFDGIK